MGAAAKDLMEGILNKDSGQMPEAAGFDLVELLVMNVLPCTEIYNRVALAFIQKAGDFSYYLH